MPFEINIGQPPIGYAVSSARRGDHIQIASQEFTSTEDGQHFVERLESLPSCLIDGAPSLVRRSQVDSLLAILRCDGTVTVYLNEVDLDLLVRARRPVVAGAGVSKDDIAEIERLRLSVDIPDDSGFIYLFSVGWRKGLFYDFGPIGPDREPRRFDPSVTLGRAVSHVVFQERFAVTDREWKSLFDDLWFPFAGLRNQTIAGLLSHVRSGWSCDDMLDDIVAEVRCQAPSMLESWRSHRTISKHMKFLERAVERFLDDDSMSCTSILFPRIEGIVRTYDVDLGNTGDLRQNDLGDLAVTAKIANDRSLLLPLRFRAYLKNVFLANFDLGRDNVPLSRNSVAHGVAKASEVGLKSAVLGILIVHQLFYLLHQE